MPACGDGGRLTRGDLRPRPPAEPAARPALGGVVESDRHGDGARPRSRRRATDVCRASAARTAGLETACSSRRSNSGLRMIFSASSAVSRLSSASVSMPLERRAREHLLQRVVAVRSFSSADADRPLEVGAREHLGDDALDDLVLRQRPADGLGQRAREHAVDGARRLRRGEHLHGHRLEPAARAGAGAARGRGDAVGAGPNDRLAQSRAHDDPRGPEHQPPGRHAEPPGARRRARRPDCVRLATAPRRQLHDPGCESASARSGRGAAFGVPPQAPHAARRRRGAGGRRGTSSPGRAGRSASRSAPTTVITWSV